MQLKYISRIEEGDKNTHGWNVRIPKRRVVFSHFFSDLEYGNKAKSLVIAIKFRDLLEASIRRHFNETDGEAHR